MLQPSWKTLCRPRILPERVRISRGCSLPEKVQQVRVLGFGSAAGRPAADDRRCSQGRRVHQVRQHGQRVHQRCVVPALLGDVHGLCQGKRGFLRCTSASTPSVLAMA